MAYFFLLVRSMPALLFVLFVALIVNHFAPAEKFPDLLGVIIALFSGVTTQYISKNTHSWDQRARRQESLRGLYEGEWKYVEWIIDLRLSSSPIERRGTINIFKKSVDGIDTWSISGGNKTSGWVSELISVQSDEVIVIVYHVKEDHDIGHPWYGYLELDQPLLMPVKKATGKLEALKRRFFPKTVDIVGYNGKFDSLGEDRMGSITIYESNDEIEASLINSSYSTYMKMPSKIRKPLGQTIFIQNSNRK